MTWFTFEGRCAGRNRHRMYRPRFEALEPRLVLDTGMLLADMSLEFTAPWSVPALESNPDEQKQTVVARD